MDTFQTLKQSCEDYAQRDDFPFATLLRLAENEVLRRLRVNLMVDRYEVTFGDTESDRVVLPPRFIELKSIKNKETNIDIDCRRVGTNLILNKPVKEVTLVAEYYKRPNDLNTNTNTNPLLAEYPAIYFYAVLSQIYTWANDLELSQYYAQLAVNEITVINDESAKQTALAQTYDTAIPSL